MALRNQNRYNKIKQTATTDALTGALNRVAYNNDLALFAEKTCDDFSCVYIDVNELHLHNNLYGHAAGDEMLVYIANVLKEVFYGHKIYRMGGDEFLVFCENTAQEVVSQSITLLQKRLERKNYCVSVGVSFRTQNTCTNEMVQEAERRMYENKSEYYQKKEQHVTSSVDQGYIQMKTGLPEIDQVLSVLTENYSGLYRVSLQTDHVKRILMPKAYNYGENETDFTKLFSKYVTEEVASVYHRTVMRFLNYDALKQQLIEGEVPQVSYKKYNGDKMRLSVYKLDETDDSVTDTLWVFANE